MSELEPYKVEFLEELEKLKIQQTQKQLDQMNQTQAKKTGFLNKVTNTNDIWNSSKYSNVNWRKDLTTTYYNKEHNEQRFDMNLELNPEVRRKNFNMRATQISEYSNAKHNNTVFVNPKFTSC